MGADSEPRRDELGSGSLEDEGAGVSDGSRWQLMQRTTSGGRSVSWPVMRARRDTAPVNSSFPRLLGDGPEAA